MPEYGTKIKIKSSARNGSADPPPGLGNPGSARRHSRFVDEAPPGLGAAPDARAGGRSGRRCAPRSGAQLGGDRCRGGDVPPGRDEAVAPPAGGGWVRLHRRCGFARCRLSRLGVGPIGARPGLPRAAGRGGPRPAVATPGFSPSIPPPGPPEVVGVGVGGFGQRFWGRQGGLSLVAPGSLTGSYGSQTLVEAGVGGPHRTDPPGPGDCASAALTTWFDDVACRRTGDRSAPRCEAAARTWRTAADTRRVAPGGSSLCVVDCRCVERCRSGPWWHLLRPYPTSALGYGGAHACPGAVGGIVSTIPTMPLATGGRWF